MCVCFVACLFVFTPPEIDCNVVGEGNLLYAAFANNWCRHR